MNLTYLTRHEAGFPSHSDFEAALYFSTIALIAAVWVSAAVSNVVNGAWLKVETSVAKASYLLSSSAL